MTTREQDIVATGCILNFSNDIYTAMDQVNTYIIFIDENEAAHPQKDEQRELSPELQEQIRQARIDVRFAIMRVHSQLRGISQIVKGFNTTEIDTIYERIKTAPLRRDCEEYINLVYTGLMNSVLKDLLASLQMDYSKLVKE